MVITVGTIIEILCIIFIIYGYYKKQYLLTAHDFIALSSITLLLDFSQSTQGVIFWATGQIFYIIYILFYRRSTLLNSFLLFMIVSLTLVQSVVRIIAIVLRLSVSDTIPFQKVIYNFVALIMVIGLTELANIEYLYIRIAEASLPVRIALVDGYILFLGVVLIYKLTAGRIISNPESIGILVLFTIATATSVLYYDQLVKTKTRELELYQKNIPIYESLISEIKANQHEFSNRLQGIQNLAVTCTDYETLKGELLTSAKQYSSPLHNYQLLRLNMPLLAASLYHLTTVAAASGITIRFEILSKNLSSYAMESDISDFASILIQNAIEACKSEDIVYVIISSEHEKVRIEVRNPVEKFLTAKEIAQFFKRNYSTKFSEQNAARGLGLYYLKEKIKGYNGRIITNCVRDDEKRYWVIMELEV